MKDAQELYSTYVEFKITKETGLSHLLNNYLKAIELKRAQILTRIMNEHVNLGIKFQFKPSEGKYDELYLSTISEISLYPMLENGDYDTVKKYLKVITGSSYQSQYFEKHKKDIRRHLQRLRRNEMDFAKRVKLKELIHLLMDVRVNTGP